MFPVRPWRTVRGSLLLVGLLLAGSPLADGPAAIRVLEQRRLSPSELGLSMPRAAATAHGLELSLVQLHGSGWRRDRVLGAVREAVTILTQCEVQLTAATWLLVGVPATYLDFDTPRSRQLARVLAVSTPTLYFVADTRQRPAFDAEAIGRGNSRTRPELADSVWITHAARDPGIVLAHELAHVLMNSGDHSEHAGNLMRDRTAPGQTRLDGGQCRQLRETATRHGLLRPGHG